MNKIRVLVIDDSAFNRKALREMLADAPDIEVVGTAGNGEEGLKQLRKLKPDLVTLDLEMPGMDGFTFLRIVMNQSPLPILVVSSRREAESVFQALELGAVDFLPKPTRTISPELYNVRDDLIRKIRAAREFRLESIKDRILPSPRPVVPRAPAPVKKVEEPGLVDFRLVVIGASTGGPAAISQILTTLRPGLPIAIAVSQHMPPGFTRAFAERLDRFSAYPIKEAEDGDPFLPQQGYISPGGKNLYLDRRGKNLVLKLSGRGRERYIPSVNMLFESAAEVAGKNCLGVLLTGMGNDGRDGVIQIKKKGGSIIAQSEHSSVVFGMPREAIETGRVDKILPIEQIPHYISTWAKTGELE
ncbi:MAG: chemotaxis response regulator protein-glutamate methylesterase [Proteobacteria bacterium]|nr:chemotaxis response regulator protein-glutamate methylesterase [Pseudomonadota bacterium]